MIEFRPELARFHSALYLVRYGNGVLNDFEQVRAYPPTGVPLVDDSQVEDWTQPLGELSTRSISITNRGSVPLEVPYGSLFSDNGFAVDDNCLGATLALGESCHITLRSVHAAPGEYTWTGWVRTDSLWMRNVSLRATLLVTTD